MRQFDLVDNPSTKSRGHAPYFIVLQSHHLDELGSVVIAPVVRDAARALTVLDIPLAFRGEAFVIALSEIASVDRGLLKSSRGSASEHEDEIRRGLERLLTGF